MAGAAERWLDRDALFAIGGYKGPASTEPGAALLLRGPLPVLLCAPHSVQHPRGGRRKHADRRTGGLALLLAEITGANALAALGPVPDLGWSDRSDPFAAALRSAVRAGWIVLDLHGMRDSHGPDICVGTRFRTEPAIARVRDGVLRATGGFRTSVDDPFAALGPRTGLAEIEAMGGTGVQIELAARLRDPEGAPRTAAQTVGALASAVRECGEPSRNPGPVPHTIRGYDGA